MRYEPSIRTTGCLIESKEEIRCKMLFIYLHGYITVLDNDLRHRYIQRCVMVENFTGPMGPRGCMWFGLSDE